MKIESNQNISRIVTGESKETVKKRTEETTATPAASVQWQPSSKQDTSQDIDMARVEEIRQAISEGRLEIHADKIADGLIASAKELLADNK